MTTLERAYSVLMNADKREIYDKLGMEAIERIEEKEKELEYLRDEFDDIRVRFYFDGSNVGIHVECKTKGLRVHFLHIYMQKMHSIR